MPKKTHVAYLVTWTELERGWGQRSDGVSLHLEQEDISKYIKDYWSSMPTAVPDEYSKPDGLGARSQLVAVSPGLYKQIKAKTNGLRMWQQEYVKARKAGDITS